MHFDERKKIYKEVYEQKSNYVHKNKLIHIPRYWLVVIWGLFMSFVVFVFAIESLGDLDKYNQSIESIKTTQKVKATIEFTPNEPEPRFVQMPSL